MSGDADKEIIFTIIDAHVKSSFHMDLGIKVFRNFELSKQVMTAST